MKRMLVATLLAGLCTTWAQAQSSITLYGSLDTGVSYTNNTQSHNWSNGSNPNGGAWRVGNGLTETDVIGVRGVDDIGGGTKVIFDVESAYSKGPNASYTPASRSSPGPAYVGITGLP